MFGFGPISLVTLALATVGLTCLGVSIYSSVVLAQFAPLSPSLSCRQMSKFDPLLLGSTWANVSLTSDTNCTNPNAYSVSIDGGSIRSITIRPKNGSSFAVTDSNFTLSSGSFPQNSGTGNVHTTMSFAVPTELAVASILKSDFQVLFEREYKASAAASLFSWSLSSEDATKRYCGFEANLQHNAIGQTSCVSAAGDLTVPGLSIVHEWGGVQPATAFNLGLNYALLRPLLEARLFCYSVMLPLLFAMSFASLFLAVRRLRREVPESRHIELSSPKHSDSQNSV